MVDQRVVHVVEGTLISNIARWIISVCDQDTGYGKERMQYSIMNVAAAELAVESEFSFSITSGHLVLWCY